MLVLTRKPGEKVVIGGGITLTVTEVHGNRVRVGVEAPDQVGVLRGELARRQDDLRDADLDARRGRSRAAGSRQGLGRTRRQAPAAAASRQPRPRQRPGRSEQVAERCDRERGPEIQGEGELRSLPAGKRLRILLVEDNRDTAHSLRLLLELYGHDVAVAYSGPDGVQAAEQWRPDVVLCDIGLPGLDGHGVARKLRENPATATARLIAVTAYGRDEDRRRSHEAGFEQHLVKPVDPADLLRVLLRDRRP
jgi:carbon storage regulator CsrA